MLTSSFSHASKTGACYHTSQEVATYELQYPTSRNGAVGHLSSQTIEGVSIFAHGKRLTLLGTICK
jgi:hypothetical protein